MQDKLQEYKRFVEIYFIDTKAYGGLIMIGFGILMLWGAIKNWNWLFDASPASYNMQKLDGIINMFGRKTGRIVTGIMGTILIPIGIGWIYLCIAHDSFSKEK